jgi:hypothetical protein
MIPKSDDIKPRHEEAFDVLRDAVNNVLEGVPEVRSVAIIVDWNVGRMELPFGMLIGRLGSVRTPAELFPIMEQTAKMSGYQAKLMAEILVRTDMEVKKIAEEAIKTKAGAEQVFKELKELESNIDAMKARIEERNSDEKK